MLYHFKRLHSRLTALALTPLALAALALLAALMAGVPQAHAAPRPGQSESAPMMAIVSLSRQKVTIYNARGKMLDAPVSTGQPGYETPAGLYSVIERKRHHFSNLYENAPMPFMHRITWSGIALHAGALPGYPASHGCIRLPYGFAGQLFEISSRGMRVAVVRDDMAPVEFAHPALFRPAAPAGGPGQVEAGVEMVAFSPGATRRSNAAAKAAAAEAAAARLREAKRALGEARDAAGEYLEKLEIAEAAKRTALATIREADDLLQLKLSASDEQTLKSARSKAQDRLTAAQAQIDAIYAEAKAKIDAAVAARAEARAAREASEAAEEEAKLAALPPVSVFISRRTQRLYVRQSFEPLFESGVTIRDPHVPIGTTLFTAMSYASKDSADELRWTALSMYPDRAARARAASGPPPRPGEPTLTNPAVAKAALERITIPKDVVDRINAMVTPGSSLIISDEGMSRETSKGTDFVVVMSGEPQGGIRRRSLRRDVFTDYGPTASTGFGPFSWW